MSVAARTVLTGTDLEALDRLGTALADPTRRRILAGLADRPAYPGDLAAALGTTRANVSNHLACLRGCGLVTARVEGRRALYRLADARLGPALRKLAALVPAGGAFPHDEVPGP
jgi:DNA-binding transcriptional ArsR family regulator